MENPTAHYTDIIEPEVWKNEKIPKLLKLIAEIEAIEFEPEKEA